MKVLTAAEMREADRRTIELGISGPILMENAGHRVVEYIAERYSPLSSQRIVVICGKGNNGGDGYVVARQLHTRLQPAALHVLALFPDDDSEPLRMLRASGLNPVQQITPEMRQASLVVDAILGTGSSGPARSVALDFIREINTGFPGARVVSIDLPSGMDADSPVSRGEFARADATVTFTAPKPCHVLPPNCDAIGDLRVSAIGTPPELLESVRLHLTEPGDFRELLRPRKLDSNKGTYGHVLAVGGSIGKTGAIEMVGIAALRVGAGLATVASAAAGLGVLELMTAPLPGDLKALNAIAAQKTVIAIGPGLGSSDHTVRLVRDAVAELRQPMVVDADGLNAMAGAGDWHSGDKFRVLTPHPGEMSRLAGVSVAEVQADRLACARTLAGRCGCTVVLKGHRSVIAFPDGRAWINSTGSPAMATGGTGDILTGIIAGLLAQFPEAMERAVLAGVYLHGLAGEFGARDLGEHSLMATDLLRYLPEAMRECARVPDVL